MVSIVSIPWFGLPAKLVRSPSASVPIPRLWADQRYPPSRQTVAVGRPPCERQQRAADAALRGVGVPRAAAAGRVGGGRRRRAQRAAHRAHGQQAGGVGLRDRQGAGSPEGARAELGGRGLSGAAAASGAVGDRPLPTEHRCTHRRQTQTGPCRADEMGWGGIYRQKQTQTGPCPELIGWAGVVPTEIGPCRN